MPSTYAHYRFGEDVYPLLPAPQRACIDAAPELYRIGLHGPDILFYYHALKSNPVSAVGTDAHDHPGRDFFRHAVSLLQEESGDARLSYVYGALCHFALDVSCHAYIFDRTRETGIAHAEIEGEFDRCLMLKNGLNPVTQCVTEHIVPAPEYAEVIAPFYPGIRPKEIHTALKSLITQNRLLLARTDFKRNLIYTVLHLSGNDDKRGMVIQPDGNPACDPICEELLRRYALGVDRAREFIESFGEILEGRRDFSPLFRYNFDGIEPESGEAL